MRKNKEVNKKRKIWLWFFIPFLVLTTILGITYVSYKEFAWSNANVEIQIDLGSDGSKEVPTAPTVKETRNEYMGLIVFFRIYTTTNLKYVNCIYSINKEKGKFRFTNLEFGHTYEYGVKSSSIYPKTWIGMEEWN